MDKKQKRKLMSTIYKTITFFSLIATGLIIYMCIDKLYTKENSVMWLDIALLIVSSLLLLFIIADSFATRKSLNKYKFSMFYYFLFTFSFIGLIALSLYCYISKIEIANYISYFIPLCLLVATELIIIINLIIGNMLSKLYKNSTIIVDSTTETPNFNDELNLKKKLDELNRKLSMKKIQDEIDKVEKELDK